MSPIRSTDVSQPTVVGEIRTSQLSGMDGATAHDLSTQLVNALVQELTVLEPQEWELPTDCERWSVKDIVAHIVGWSEGLADFSEMTRQFTAGLRRIKEFGNPVDAQNEVQVEARRDLSIDELIDRLRRNGPLAARRRRSLSRVIGKVPLYHSFFGGWTNVGYLANAIFPRDLFVHRIDISRATKRPLELGTAEAKLVEDIARDWFRRSGAQARLELTGPVGAVFVSDRDPETSIRADALDFVRFLFGRDSLEVFEISGNETRARSWLSVFFPV
jgi:uncharacterized protein (TIGR03083 family)